MTSDIFTPLISSVIGGAITAGANLWLARQQHINNIKNIKFERNRTALQDLKANHLRLKRTMLVLEQSINLYENNFMPMDMYEENFSWGLSSQCTFNLSWTFHFFIWNLLFEKLGFFFDFTDFSGTLRYL